MRHLPLRKHQLPRRKSPRPSKVNPESLTVFGHVMRPHGLRGALKVRLHGGITPQIEIDEPVFILLQGGPVPFFSEDRVDASRDTIVLKLEGIDTVDAAEALTGKQVLVDPSRITDEEPTGLHALIGFTVSDQKLGDLGTVTDVMEMQMQSVLEVEHHSGKQILIPAVEHILHSIDMEGKCLNVETPDGLVDIYLNG